MNQEQQNKINIKKVAVLGAGSFGSVLTNIVSENASETVLWLRNQDQLEQIEKTRKNSRYFENFEFSPRISFSADLRETVENADLVILAVPSSAFPSLLETLAALLSEKTIIVSTAKGLAPKACEQGSGIRLMSELVKEALPANPVVVLSGPNIAVEIAEGQLTGSVIAGSDAIVNQAVQSLLSSKVFRVYDNADLHGVELSGALKNIYAIAAGMADAMNMGQNSRAMLLTRSLAEMSRFAVLKGANPMSFLGLAGVGDLFVTCTSTHSRNFRLGQLIVQGKTASDAIAEIGSTVEGYLTVKTVVDEAESLNIYMPLANALYQVLYEDVDILSVVKQLMLGESSHDVEFSLGSDT